MCPEGDTQHHHQQPSCFVQASIRSCLQAQPHMSSRQKPKITTRLLVVAEHALPRLSETLTTFLQATLDPVCPSLTLSHEHSVLFPPVWVLDT